MAPCRIDCIPASRRSLCSGWSPSYHCFGVSSVPLFFEKIDATSASKSLGNGACAFPLLNDGSAMIITNKKGFLAASEVSNKFQMGYNFCGANISFFVSSEPVAVWLTLRINSSVAECNKVEGNTEYKLADSRTNQCTGSQQNPLVMV